MECNTTGTRGGPGGRDRTLAVKRRKKIIFFCKKQKLQDAKILGETNFQPREFPRSWSKAKDRKLVITMACYALQPHLGWPTQSHLAQSAVFLAKLVD